MLLQYGLATQKLDALLAALFSRLGDGLGDLVADESRVLSVAQALEAWRTPEAELNNVGQVSIVGVEEPPRPARDQRQVLLDGGEGLDTGPEVDAVDEVAGAR